MKKTMNTKKALLMSALSLLLCVSMLVGTTFAWFTDTVVSGKNQIVAGNLDVVLEYSKDGETWTEVNSETSVFDDSTLWEPGHTEVVALRVSNAGTLALKYNLNTTVFSETPSINVYGQSFLLSDYLEVGGIVMDGVPAGDALVGYYTGSREAAQAIYDGGYKTAFRENIAENQLLMPGDYSYVVLAITMPETVGNEANYRTGEVAPTIDFSINLYATQYTHEEDSFDNQYDKDAEYATLPVASITANGASTETLVWNQQYSAATTNVLDSWYTFKTTETYDEAQESEYRYWHADFVVTFDKAVAANTVGLAGNYGNYNWIGFTNPEDLAAGESVRLLETAGISMNYEELCLLVEEFLCGAWNLNNDNAGTTMTVELRLYETEPADESNGNSKNVETGNYFIVNSTSYTLEELAVPSDLPVANVTDADEYENTAIEWNTQYGIQPTNTNQQLESVYVFTAEDSYEEAQQSPYADWIADYYVTVDKDIAAGTLVLGGNYGSYGWIGFENPEAVSANTATPLLQSANMTFTYEDIVLLVSSFTCGVADVNDALTGATLTVELRLTNPENTSEYYVINSTSYTFE